MSDIREYFDSLRGKRIAVIGMGVSNTPLIRMLLGLNFVQQVVEQCGGSVELESVEREGTVVTVSLPPCEEDVCETGPV